MGKTFFTVVCLIMVMLSSNPASATQKIISGVPNYDQDLFPIDNPSAESGDCVPVACTMLNGYYDSHGWPRLIPYGSNDPSLNAWGVDTVVRKYKSQLGYIPNEGTGLTWWDGLSNKLGNGIFTVTQYFDSGANFSCDDDDWTSFSKMQSYLNSDYPCVLAVQPSGSNYPTYKFEGSSVMYEIDGGHAVCAVGWSDSGGNWIICNMGWSYATRGWINADGGDDWYVSQVAPSGSPSGEDDDAYEDNDTIGTAHEISAGTINNLRCFDTLEAGGYYSTSYGDWYKINVSAGQPLSITINFINANGNLNLHVYDPSQTLVGNSLGTGNSENVSLSSTSSGYYYIFVHGYNNAQNANYSLTVGTGAAIYSAGHDFNSDSQPDIFWRNTATGENGIWYMTGVTHSGGAMLDTVSDVSWQIVGLADFNNDGKADIFWRNTRTGENGVWYMNGMTHTSGAMIDTVGDVKWQIVGLGDFNGDGKPDILWRHAATGQNGVWYMDGVTRTGSAMLDTIGDVKWEIVGLADFNNDGKLDIFWRHAATGQNGIWYMDGVTRASSATVDTVGDVKWQIVGLADFNSDGKPDILWRNSATGQNGVWYMDGVSHSGGVMLDTVSDTRWQIVGR